MNFGNFGIGLNAAVQGFRQGVALGNEIKGLHDESQVRNLQAQGMKDSQATRNADIDGLIKPTGTDAQGQPTGFQVGERTFTSKKDAQAFAGQQVGSAMDYFNNTYAPQIRDMYMEQGNVQKATDWEKFSQDAQTQKGMRSLARANLARMMGDTSGMLKHLMVGANSNPGMGGYKINGAEPITDDKGNTLGYRMTVQAPDGSINTRDIEGGEDGIWKLASGLMSPDKQFASWQTRQEAASKLSGEIAKEKAKVAATTAGNLVEEKAKQTGRVQIKGMEEAGADRRNAATIDGARDRELLGIAGAGQKRGNELNAEGDYLRGLGYTDDQIAGLAPAQVAGRAATSNNDAGGKAYDNLSRTDFTWNDKSPEERQAAAVQAARERAAVSSSVSGLSAGQRGTAPNPFTQGAPAAPASGAAPAAAAAPAASVPVATVIDPATGKIIPVR